MAGLDLEGVAFDFIKLHEACHLRRLVDATKWCSELLFYLPEQLASSSELVMDNLAQIKGGEKRILRFVHSCFDCKEFKRAARLSEGVEHPLIRFLHYYARYLDGEQQKLDNMADVMDKTVKFKNEELQSLYEDILETMASNCDVDPYLNYLFGLILVEMNMSAKAVNCLVESVNSEPILWPAWLELSKLIDTKEQLSKLNLPDNWMKQLMLGEVYGRWQMPREALQIYEELRDIGFGHWPYITTQMASAYHTLQELDSALELFQELFNQDPYRLDQMDIYSNTLFVKEMRIELAKLAHHCYKVNKFCPETCGVVGNYYTIRGDHERAVLYFQRALKLDPGNGGAWTLMGHAFMELKNTAAASLAYRHALEINPKDFRAWYSLGQLYDILRMPSYAMYYYNLAHRTRPQDSRMLMALGDMLAQQSRTSDAKKCFWKAHCVGDIEGLAIVKLAKLFEKEEKRDGQAAALYRMFLQQLEQQGLSDPENEAACYKFLADYCLKQNKLQEAHQYAQYCAEYDETKEHGRGILRKIAQKQTVVDEQDTSMQIDTDGASVSN